MCECRQHRVIAGQRRRAEFLQDPARILHRVAIALGIVAHVDIQIDEAEAELPHLPVGRAEGARALHFLEQVIGNRRASFVVPREQI